MTASSMSNICLWSLKWSHLIIDGLKYQSLLTQHPHTDDSYIHVVWWIVKNAEWKIYLHHDVKRNEFLLPGWKVEHGETYAQALIRELDEELDIEVNKLHHISSIKYRAGMLWCFHMFVIDEYTGIPQNNDAHKYDHYRAEIIDSDNDLGYAVKIDGTITDDVQDIMHSFLDIYHRKTISPQWDADIACTAPYRVYDTTMIDPHQHYYLYFDDAKQEYYVDGI